jgi:hypothetical protein
MLLTYFFRYGSASLPLDSHSSISLSAAVLNS